ncbi:unnamed protein product [Dovyalis caffra]|uniref:Uncharacterized protein n=1 Tax=Dovyalis caffra TaxID=77055 RepID=A0AAV1S0D5_9ROSI|nr:unnamed protein product [Dovyalis caffra]
MDGNLTEEALLPPHDKAKFSGSKRRRENESPENIPTDGRPPRERPVNYFGNGWNINRKRQAIRAPLFFKIKKINGPD